MIYYTDIKKLLIDYRNHFNQSQLDIAVSLDIDPRTVIRWEKGETLIKGDMEEKMVTELGIPYQVVHNLNSNRPIPVYYDIQNRTYATNVSALKIPNADWLKQKLPIEETLIRPIDPSVDIEVINSNTERMGYSRPMNEDVLRWCNNSCPEGNFIFYDHSGFYAGHVCLLRIREQFLDKLINGVSSLNDITQSDVDEIRSKDSNPIYLFYSHYADSLVNVYALMTNLFLFLKRAENNQHVFCAAESKAVNIDLLQQMGLKTHNYKKEQSKKLLIGNLNSFLGA